MLKQFVSTYRVKQGGDVELQNKRKQSVFAKGKSV